jgi:hyaluronate lyase
MYFGTHKDVKDTKITARKSWFFFDNEIVCLGSAINDFSETPVITCVENRLWREGDALTVNGKELIPTEKTSLSAKNAHFTNMGGYVFFDESDLSFEKTVKSNHRNASDTSTRDFLEIVIDHGVGDGKLNGTYAYAYLPTASSVETSSYSDAPDVTVVANTEKVHAVYEKTLDILAINFFEADTVSYGNTTVSATSPLSIMINGNDINVSDPTKKLDVLKFSINGKEYSVTDPDTLAKTFTLNA